MLEYMATCNNTECCISSNTFSINYNLLNSIFPIIVSQGLFIKRQTSGTSRGKEQQRVVHWVATNDNEWQQMKTSGITSDIEWYNEWQKMTTSHYFG